MLKVSYRHISTLCSQYMDTSGHGSGWLKGRCPGCRLANELGKKPAQRSKWFMSRVAGTIRKLNGGK